MFWADSIQRQGVKTRPTGPVQDGRTKRTRTNLRTILRRSRKRVIPQRRRQSRLLVQMASLVRETRVLSPRFLSLTTCLRPTIRMAVVVVAFGREVVSRTRDARS